MLTLQVKVMLLAAAAREALHMTKHGDFTLRLKWEKVQSPNHFSPSTTMKPTMEGYPSTSVDAPELRVRQLVDQYRSKEENDTWKHPAIDQYVSRALKDTETLEQWLSDLQPGSRAFQEMREGLRLVQRSLESNLSEARSCWLEAECASSYLEHISNCMSNPPAHSMLTEARDTMNEVKIRYGEVTQNLAASGILQQEKQIDKDKWSTVKEELGMLKVLTDKLQDIEAIEEEAIELGDVRTFEKGGNWADPAIDQQFAELDNLELL